MDGKQQLEKQYIVVIMFLVFSGTFLAIHQKNKALLGVTYTFMFMSLVAYYLCKET